MKRVIIKCITLLSIVLSSCTKLDFVAGNPEQLLAYKILDGNLNTARFSDIQEITVDDQGNLYILDVSGDNRSIRKIAQSNVTTIFTTTGIQSLKCLDGYFYFIKGYGIYKLNKDGKGQPELVTGSIDENLSKDGNLTEARLGNPIFMNFDNDKNLFVFESDKFYEIRKVDLKNNIVSTFGLKKILSNYFSNNLFSGDTRNLIIDKISNSFYFNILKGGYLEAPNNIVKLELNTNILSQYSMDIGDFRDKEISGIINNFIFDDEGSIYITTRLQNHNLYKITKNNQITKLSSLNQASYNLAIDNKNKILYLSSGKQIYKISTQENN